MDPNTTILRVKRKRGTDPADALLLACKRIRPESSQSPVETVPEPDETEEVENSVFKLVATVATQVRGPAEGTKTRLANETHRWQWKWGSVGVIWMKLLNGQTYSVKLYMSERVMK